MAAPKLKDCCMYKGLNIFYKTNAKKKKNYRETSLVWDFFFLLYNIVLVLPYIDMDPPWVYMCSPSWTPLPPPSPYHRSGSSQCTSSEQPVSCIKPGLAIRFTYDNLHVLVPFSHISHPLPLPQSPKDCSIHLCLFCCLAYRVIVTIFLNSIYMC